MLAREAHNTERYTGRETRDTERAKYCLTSLVCKVLS